MRDLSNRSATQSSLFVAAGTGFQAGSLTHDPVAVAVLHVWVRRVIKLHRRDAVLPRFLAGNAPVAVVVVLSQGARIAGTWGDA